jgi:hypothetical protein
MGTSDAVKTDRELIHAAVQSPRTATFLAVGVAAASLLFVLTGYGTQNVALRVLSGLFATVGASGFAWFTWQFLIPIFHANTHVPFEP